MKKNPQQLADRKFLVRMAINNKHAAAEYIRKTADTLEKSVTVEQAIRCLASILYLAEQTIENDLYLITI